MSNRPFKINRLSAQLLPFLNPFCVSPQIPDSLTASATLWAMIPDRTLESTDINVIGLKFFASVLGCLLSTRTTLPTFHSVGLTPPIRTLFRKVKILCLANSPVFLIIAVVISSSPSALVTSSLSRAPYSSFKGIRF